MLTIAHPVAGAEAEETLEGDLDNLRLYGHALSSENTSPWFYRSHRTTLVAEGRVKLRGTVVRSGRAISDLDLALGVGGRGLMARAGWVSLGGRRNGGGGGGG